MEKCKQDVLSDINRLDQRTNVKLLQSLLVFLWTQSWSKRSSSTLADENELEMDISLAEIKEYVEHISTQFRVPLEAKNVLLATLQDEVEEVAEYAQMYLDINGTEYRKV